MKLFFIYNILINCARPILNILAKFNPKINKGVIGRKQTFDRLRNHISKSDRTLWFHCASLGEYEQGLPVFEALRKQYETHKIVLSFFSPSGYENKKESDIADVVVYLPLDTKKNAREFTELLQPEIAIFVKYELWPNLLAALNDHDCKLILISALLRSNQVYFKAYGKLLRQSLFHFDHIFVQDESSRSLLEGIGYHKVTVSGDTRFDRVYDQLQIDNTLDFIEDFKGNSLCVVAGSTWPEDEKLLIDYINRNASPNLKFVLAPHDIKSSQITSFQESLNARSIRYTEIGQSDLSNFEVLIVDTIGLLSRIYSYADIAYVGGAAGKTGLHNTLEPAVFGIPIVIGPEFRKFQEAVNLVSLKGCISVKNQNEFSKAFDQLKKDVNFREKTGKINYNYIQENKGATAQIFR